MTTFEKSASETIKSGPVSKPAPSVAATQRSECMTDTFIKKIYRRKPGQTPNAD